jgi:hypothetical protein
VSTPPRGSPPILLSIDYAREQPPLPTSPAVHYTPTQLRLASSVPDGNEGAPASATPFRDVLLMAQLSLVEGANDDLYGVFVRSASPNLYYTFAVTPSRVVQVSRYDGHYEPQVSGPMAPDMKFAAGLNAPNVFQVVAVGPSLTFMLNSMVVTAVTVDPRYKEGYVGFYVHHGTKSTHAELAVDWVQVRAILPEEDVKGG